MTSSGPKWQHPAVSDLEFAVQDLTRALRLIRGTPPGLVVDPGYRDVAIIKAQEALWWVEALRDAAKE